MLRFLRIRNLAVIDSLAVEFGPGFTVLTGETGAGKSILVEAVGLLLGGRASPDLVRTGEAVASIEAQFEDEAGAEWIVRRELTSQGRSRSFLNGALATAAALKELSLQLVELHGQHEHQRLLDPATHLPVLDEFAGLQDARARVAQCWEVVSTIRAALDRATLDVREREARLDLIGFQLSEIERVAPLAGEDEELSATRQVLASADRVQRLCSESFAALYESDQSALSALAAVRKRLGELADIEPRFAEYVTVAESVKSQLEDLAWFARDYRDRIDASPERLQAVEDRLAAVERLKRKHGPTLEQVVTRWESLRRERDLLANAGEKSDELQQELDGGTRAYLDAARSLSVSRRQAAPRFSAALERLLAELAMASTRFNVRFNEGELPADAWSADGIDRAEFYLSPNPGEDLRPLARIVSGGELSRVMLALKTLTARQARPGAGAAPAGDAGSRTLIFDEVDAGIGGQVADVVGQRLADLGREFQVLCITHLPQIAARASAHLQIVKAVRRGRTATSVNRIEGDDRVAELARMIGGARTSEALRTSARELLAGADPAKAKGESESPARGESPARRRS